MYKLFFIFFVFISTIINAEDAITQYLTSENDTLSLVEGIVNAYNGKLVQIDKDIEIHGSDPLDVTRYYDGGHHFESDYGYGIGLAFPLTLIYEKKLHTKNMWIELRGGSQIPFNVKESRNNFFGKINSEFLRTDYTNCCEGLLRGETDITAMSVYGDKNTLIVDLGNGLKRHYRYFKKNSSKRHYRLIKEERPNGNFRYFDYIKDKSSTPKRIWTTNRNNSLTLNWLNFNFRKWDYTVTASNDEQVNYYLESKKYKAKIKRKIIVGGQERKIIEVSGHQNILKRVSGKHVVTTEYDALKKSRGEASSLSTTEIKKPDGRNLSVEYDDKGRIEKIILNGIKRPLYTFNYQKDCTIVTNALNHKKHYEFNQRKLVKFTEPHRIQEYVWNNNGQLTAHIFKDPKQNIISQKQYTYDAQGNIVEAKIFGNICQCGSYEPYIIRKSYSQDGRNNLISENHNNEREFTYDYLPNTNLIVRKLTYANNGFQEREFYDYDENGIMIRKIVDDGNALECDNLSNVTYRRITRIEPQLNQGLPGMTLPKWIKEWYFDPISKEERLLKMEEKIYTNGDLLLAIRTYDSNGNYCYSRYFEYNEKKQLTGEIDPYNYVTLYQYDANGNKTYEEKINSGKKSNYIYDGANRLVQEIEKHESGRVFTTSHAYDAMSNRISTTNHFGQTTTFEYDGQGREITNINPLLHYERKEYDIFGNVTKVIDREGYVTITTHNLFGKPLEIIYPDGSTKRFAYNLQNHLIQEWERDRSFITYDVDYKGNVTLEKTYAADGTLLKQIQRQFKGENLISETDALGNTTTYRYDGAGRKIEMIKGGVITHYVYDNLGFLSKTIHFDYVEVKIHDYIGQLIEERTEDLSGVFFKKSEMLYDMHGNLILVKTYKNVSDFAETKTVYNSENLPIAIIDPLGNETSIIYHYSDHLEKETIDPMGRKTIEMYDQIDRIFALFKFNASNQLLSKTDFAYDKRGYKVIEKHANIFENEVSGDFTIVTTYDDVGQKTSVTEQNEKTNTYTYENCKLYQIIKPDGITLTHTYDDLCRLRELSSSDKTIHYRYSYDLNDNLLKTEDLIQNASTERSYDSLNRLILEKQMTGNLILYAYDQADRLKSVKFQNEKITYSYSPTGLKQASRYNNEKLAYSFTQDLDFEENPILQKLPNDVNLVYVFDALERCKEIVSKNFQQSFTYNPVGNITETKVTDPLGAYTTNFSYDDLNQIKSESGAFENNYAFDSLNNRKSKNNEHTSVDHLNRLLNNSKNYFSADSNGNRISKNDIHYSYDALGRLTKVILPEDTITYTYDSFSRRMQRISNAGTIQYLYQFDTEIGSLVDGKIEEFRAIHGQFAPFAIELNNEVYSPIRNHRGDICLLIDSQKNPVVTYRYDAFGEFLHTGSLKSPWSFSGQRYDETLQLYHFLHRDYDSSTGTFLTTDPAGFSDGPNLYAYVHNNPMIYVDPYGLFGESLKEFTHSFSRGVVDDTTWGASTFLLGEHDTTSLNSKLGYYTGTGASMGAGLLYGSTWAKGLGYFGKIGTKAYNVARRTIGVTKKAKGVAEARTATKLIQEAKPALQKVTQTASSQKILDPLHSLSGENLKRHLQYCNKYKTLDGSKNVKYLQNGRIRYYKPIEQAKVPGEMFGRRYVHEFNPASGLRRGWHETVDHFSRVRQTRPQLDPSLKKHYRFDEFGNFENIW